MKDISGVSPSVAVTEIEIEEVNDGSIQSEDGQSSLSSAPSSSHSGSLLELPELVLDRSYEANSSPDAQVVRDPLPAAIGAAASHSGGSIGTNSSSGHSGNNNNNNTNDKSSSINRPQGARRRLSFRDIFLLPLRAGRNKRRRSASANFEEPTVHPSVANNHRSKSRKQSGCAGWLDITKRWKSPTRSNSSASCDDLPALVPASHLYGPLHCSRCGGQDDSCHSSGATYTKRPAGVDPNDAGDVWLCAPCLREERRFSSSSSSSSMAGSSSSWTDGGGISCPPSVAHLAQLAMDSLLKSNVSLAEHQRG